MALTGDLLMVENVLFNKQSVHNATNALFCMLRPLFYYQRSVGLLLAF
jgi:hypothetical protein